MSIYTPLDINSPAIDGFPRIERHLTDLKGCFADQRAYANALAHDDPLIYSVVTVEPADGEGQLHYGLAKLMPGRIGAEYYMTRGHLHTFRAAAEVYLGMKGTGLVVIEGPRTGEAYTMPLNPYSISYVPGYVAHRTVNIGNEPLVYLGIYPAGAGCEYLSMAERNFGKVVADVSGQPAILDRTAFLAELNRR